MKKLLQKTKSYFSTEIKQAKNDNYDAIILPINHDEEPHYLIDASNIDDIYDIPTQNEWEAFILIDFMREEEKFIDLYNVAA